MKKVLITGGAGYIASHTNIELLKGDFELVLVDNFCNSCAESIKRVEELSGRKVTFYEADLMDAEALDNVFAQEKDIDSVIHFAALKAVGDSVAMPLAYYTNNITGSLNLYQAMKNHDVSKIVFSSSATVYGEPASVPITEDFPLSATNPYGDTKLKVEEMLEDLYRSSPAWRIARLRYFNPVGAHESGLIGESPSGEPSNLMPFITQAAAGLRDELSVFGDDYETPDGTGVRDYIHVVDLASGHVAALDYLDQHQELLTVNLGTGEGVSVFEMIKTFETVNHCKVPYKIAGRRSGDVARCWADTGLANDLLGWKATRTLEDMCRDAWNWQTKDN